MGLFLLFTIALLLIVLIGTIVLIRQMTRPYRLTTGAAIARGWPSDPADVQLDSEEATFSLSDGSVTPGWIIRGQKVDGPTVIYLHGFASSKLGGLRQAAHLAPHAARIILFDQRGTGEAEAPTAHFTTTEVEDVLGILDQFTPFSGRVHSPVTGTASDSRDNATNNRETSVAGATDSTNTSGTVTSHADETTQGSTGEQARPLNEVNARIVLFGSSLGAATAIAAGHRDRRIVGVIAAGAFRQWKTPVHRRMQLRKLPTWPVIDLAGLYMAWQYPGLRTFDRAEHAAKLNIPLLLLHGADDPICPLEEAREIAAAAKDATLVVFDDGKHSGLADHDPTMYREAMQNFFSNLSKVPDTPQHSATQENATVEPAGSTDRTAD